MVLHAVFDLLVLYESGAELFWLSCFCCTTVKQRSAYRSNCMYNTQNRTARFARSIRFLNLPAAAASVMNQWQLHAICGSPGCSGSGLHCQARLRLEHALQRFYKFTEFRPGQLEAMLSVLHCKDVFVRMATGSGKSLCMFLPPLAVTALWL